MKLNDPWFEYVRTGRKIYEGRRWWAPTQALRPNDWIVFERITYPEQKCQKQIQEILWFPTFEAALQVLPLADVLPGVQSIEEGVAIYSQFVSLATQLRDGICMIRLQNLSNARLAGHDNILQ